LKALSKQRRWEQVRCAEYLDQIGVYELECSIHFHVVFEETFALQDYLYCNLNLDEKKDAIYKLLTVHLRKDIYPKAALSKAQESLKISSQEITKWCIKYFGISSTRSSLVPRRQ